MLDYGDTCFVDLVDLGQRDGAHGDTEEGENIEVLTRLRHYAIVGGHDQQCEIDPRCTSQHGVNETFVARDIDEPKDLAVVHRLVRVTQFDRDTARLLLGQAIGVHAGQRTHQRRLAVIDVPCGTDNHDAVGRTLSPGNWATNAASSSSVRRSRISALSATRPMTGTGNARSAAASTLSRRPVPLPSLRQRMNMPALGRRSTGSDPLPIWLWTAPQTTSNCAPTARASAGATLLASASISTSGRVSRRSVGRRVVNCSGWRYKASVASNAASVSLETRHARLSGCFLILPIHSRLPTMSPACGPPRSLSPLKVTMSAPLASASCGVGSCGRPYCARSTRLPLPRSTASGRPAPCAMSASWASSTAAVKPFTA